MGVCVFIRTHTHRVAHCTDGVLGCEPETPGGLAESRWTKSRLTYIRRSVQSTHVYVYARRRDAILDNCFFL